MPLRPMPLRFRRLPSLALIGAAVWLASCSGNRGLNGNGATPPGGGLGGTVTLTMSAAATCGGGSPFTAVWLTIADVEASPNANAPAGDASFVDLTPQLKSAPEQINLLGSPSQCVLATLASAVPATSEKYAQIRVFLAPDSEAGSIANNACGTYANCATSAGGTAPIAVGGAATQGIALSGAALDGGFTVTSGATATVNVNFDICAALAAGANGQLSLNPQLSGGAINAQADTISGAFEDAATQAAVSGPVLVALEQNENGTDRVLMQTFAGASGGFQFCPVPAGNYEIVAGAESSTGGQYSPTAVLQVPNGASLSSPPLPLYAGNGANAEPATIAATLTSAGAAGVAVPVLTTLTLQAAVTPSAGATYSLAIPLPEEPSAAMSLLTATGASCPTGTACTGPITLSVPAVFVSFGQYAGSGAQIENNTSLSAAYLLDAQASSTAAARQPDCTPSEVTENPGQISPQADLTAPPLTFTACQ
ncbi:MAG: DUF4382 domain-containing protein [Terriglobales bacterium]